MLYIRTPLIVHPSLSTASRRIWLKLGNQQTCGSGVSISAQRLGEWARMGI